MTDPPSPGGGHWKCSCSESVQVVVDSEQLHFMEMEGIDGINCVKGEIHNVLAVLRLHTRLASEPVYFDLLLPSSSAPEHLLFRGFRDLYDSLSFYNSLDEVDASLYLSPFLKVIESEQVSAETTHTALHSVHKFLLYGLLRDDSPGIFSAIQSLAKCTIDCKFQAPNVTVAEVLYMKVMEVLLECVRCPAGHLLTDSVLCDMFQVSFHIRNDPSSSALLCQYAENILMQFTLVVFAHLKHIAPEPQNKGYGPGAMHRVLKFLAEMINPDDAINDKNTREFGLRLINIALETSGTSIGNHEILVSVVQDDLCKQLLQNSQTDHPSILSLSLRIVFNLFTCVKQHLKIQLEVFFRSIHLRIAESSASSFEQKELVLESLVEFCHEPSLIVGLYRNYDCEIASSNLFEDLCKFLSQLAIPSESANHSKSHNLTFGLNSLNILSLEAILAILNSICKRFCDPNTSNYALEMEENRQILYLRELEGQDDAKSNEMKKLHHLAVSKFNSEGPKSFKYLQTLGFLSDPLSSESLANFFRNTPGLDHYLVGAFLGIPKEFNMAVLSHYVSMFEFQKLRIDEALRIFLESFVLPGEAQIIERFMDNFAKVYFAQNNGICPILDEESACILSFSIIMLNTDLNNPNVSRKMTPEQWIKNNTGLNKKEDFPMDFLLDIYDSIKEHEIKITSANLKDLLSADGARVNTSEWNKLIHKSRNVGDFKTSVAYVNGKEMFLMVYVTSIHILNFYIQKATNTKVSQRIVEGYHSFANICGVYKLTEHFNNLIIPLCNSLSESLQIASMDSNGFDPLASFGRNKNAQRLANLLFNIINSHHDVHLKEAWPNILQCLLWLNHLELLPKVLTQMDDFRDTEGDPLPSLREACARKKSSHIKVENSVKRNLGFFSAAFQSIWGTNAVESHVHEAGGNSSDLIGTNSPQEGSSEFDHYRSIARECILSCHIEEMFSNCATLDDESLLQLIHILILVSSHCSNSVEEPPLHVVGISGFSDTVLTESSAVFCVERLSEIVEHNASRLHLYWPILKTHFEYILTHCVSKPTFYLERIIVNLMQLGILLVDSFRPELVDIMQLIERLLDLPADVISQFASRVISGLCLMLKMTNGKALSHYQCWSTILVMLQRLALLQPSSCVIDALEHLARNHITVENWRQTFDTLVVLIQNRRITSEINSQKMFEILLQVHSRIKLFATWCKKGSTGLSKEDLKSLWLYSVEGFCKLSHDSRVSIRILAIDALQRALLASGVVMKSPVIWKLVFETILLPQLTSDHETTGIPPSHIYDVELPSSDVEGIAVEGHDLVKSEGNVIPPRMDNSENEVEISDTDIRIKISNFLFQILLHKLQYLIKMPEFQVFWLKFIGTMEKFMLLSTDPQGPLALHFTESLRNALLVMNTSGAFENLRDQVGIDLLELTLSVLGSFQPSLLKELESSFNSAPNSQQ